MDIKRLIIENTPVLQKARTVLESTIVKNWPEKGVNFINTSELYFHPVLTDGLLNLWLDESLERRSKFDVIVALEARGFLIAGLLAQKLKLPVLLLRKIHKLPPPVIQYSYDLEYGSDVVEMRVEDSRYVSDKKVLVVDDLIATGGTLQAAVSLLRKFKPSRVEALTWVYLTQFKPSFDFESTALVHM